MTGTRPKRSYQEALEISRQLGDRRGLAMALFSIGRVARVRGDYAAARSYLMEAHRGASRRWATTSGWPRHTITWASRRTSEGDLATAREQYEACLAIFERLGDELGIVTALDGARRSSASRKVTWRRRSRSSRTSLEMARGIDDKDRIAMALAALAGLAAAQGRPTRALRLAAAATALVEATGQRNSPAWHAMLERWLAPARRTLSPEACAAACAAGRAMPLDDVIEYALSLVRPSASDGPTLGDPGPDRIQPRARPLRSLLKSAPASCIRVSRSATSGGIGPVPARVVQRCRHATIPPHPRGQRTG